MAHENTIPPDDTSLGPIEIGVLEAHRDASTRKEELLPLLAKAIGVQKDQVFYTWAFRRCKQSGQIADTGWSYYFHGLECDLRHEDGRFLRIDFGPKGRLDTFNEWGVLQYILKSTSPWPEYPDLKRHFTAQEPPFDRDSESYGRMRSVVDALERLGAFEPADSELVALQARYTTVGPDGLRSVRFPQGTPEEVQIDCSVAHRRVLSTMGRRLLESHSVSQTA